jgi:ribulose-5-phosphate 4-epimerase/fuculose-1-phosphate aldolase
MRTATRRPAAGTAKVGALLDDLVTANHILFDQGVVDGFGHISGRSPQNPNRFYMSRALAPGLVMPDDLMEFDLDGNAIDQRGRRLYVERFIHAELYRARGDVMSVVHSHSPGVLPFGVSKTKLKAMVQSGSFLGQGVPVFDAIKAGGKFGFLINTPALGKALAKALGKETVVLMRAHGDTVVGGSVRAATAHAINTELSARLQMQAMALGSKVQYLTPREIKTTAVVGASPQLTGGEERVWQMWTARARRNAL